MTLRFGTDGVRGVAGRELTPELVLALGRAAARVLGGPFLVGRDTRRSGPLLQAAFSAGVAAEGADVVDLGVLPTPGVAYGSSVRGAPAAVISASHNPFADNGVKLLAAGGRKLSDAEEEQVESLLPSDPGRGEGPEGAALGRLEADPSELDRYCDHVVGSVEGRSLGGLRVAIDCGHGAAFASAPRILAAAGADVVAALGVAPDGVNINDRCGSTDPSGLIDAVRRTKAAAGLAFDGDADRVIAVDDRGEVVDGDRLLALFAADLQARRRLSGDAVAVTVMTNLGFHRAMVDLGIEVGQTAVGDRYILEALDRHGWSLGGEQSGHIIFRDLATTGDGVMTGLLLLDLMARRGAALSQMASASMTRLPQVLRNVRVADHAGLDGAESVWAEVSAVEADLGDSGRVLLRTSGTEKLVRVMVEAPSEAAAEQAVARLADAVISALGAPATD